MREADVLIHVVDISHSDFEDHINVVNETLMEIGAGDKNTLMVFNKIDAFTFVEKDADDLTPILKENISLEQLKKSWMSKTASNCVFISAAQKENIDAFKRIVYDTVKEIHQKRYPYNNLLY